MNNIILIVSYGDDVHKRVFEEVAIKNNYKPLLFDAGGYPIENEELSINFLDDNLFISVKDKKVDPNDIFGVWWRRPRNRGKDKITAMDRYMQLEGEVLVRSLRDFLPDVNWVSDPEATRMACRKPVQLLVAKKLGLKIPDTYLGNSPEGLLRFLKMLNNKKIIIKPIGTSFIDLSSDGSNSMVVFTKIVEKQLILDNMEMVKNCPVIFQEAVEKDSDVRITIVDDQVFCAEVSLFGCSDPNNVDWRNHDGKRVYTRHELPKKIQLQCIAFTKAMGLRFGCIDMAYSKKNGYTFFEINPQGQWLPSEIDLGYPISIALLKSLTRQGV